LRGIGRVRRMADGTFGNTAADRSKLAGASPAGRGSGLFRAGAELGGVQALVDAAVREELGVGALLSDAAGLHDDDAVGAAGRWKGGAQ
jgi:hypothetical protein